MIARLMTARRFAPLFWCQFASALNDNFVKNALVFLIVFQVGAAGSGGPGGEGGGGALVTLAGAIFIAPYLLLSALGGELADRMDKALLARRLKLAEIGVAAVAAAGFLAHSLPVLFVALAGFGVIAALFGPVKYGLLPDNLSTDELVSGNALVEAGTFLAILLGTIGGGMAAARGANPAIAAVGMVALALLCWLAARLIPSRAAAAPDLAVNRNPLTSTLALVRLVRADRRLWTGSLVAAWFWPVGAVALSLLPLLVRDRVGGSEAVVTLLLAAFAVGVAAGSMLAAAASHGRPNLALVPIGGAVMTLAGLDLALNVSGLVPAAAPLTAGAFLATGSGLRLLLDFVALALGGGLFVVPSFAAVQSWSRPGERARVIAVGNVLSAAFIVASGLAVAALQALGVGLGALFLGLALANLAVTVLVLRAWGREGARGLGALLFKALFRAELRGAENLPPVGTRMVIAPNHVSLIDGPLLHALLPIDAAFAVDTGIAKAWWAAPFLKLIDAHTMDPGRPLAARALAHLVKSGRPVVIFPEGRVTVTGALMKVYDGAAMIADRGEAVVVPVRIEGAQRSFLSYLKQGEVKRALFPKIVVTVLPARPLPIPEGLRGRARRVAAGAALQDVMVEALVATAIGERTLFQALVEARATRDTGRPAVADPMGGSLSYGRLILGAQVLGRALIPLAPAGANVGVLLPNAAGVAATFFALQSIGRVPAMLNFSAGSANVLAAMAAAQVGVVLTSRAFVEKAKLGPLVEAVGARARVVYLEDVRAGLGLAQKLRGLLDGARPLVARRPDDPAVVLFTSGSEGTPKGVVLSHRNLLANAAQALARVDANGRDLVFNALPVFHSFGLTGGLLMPLMGGVPVFLYPSPLHYRIVPELIYQTGATVLFGTDTFLMGYARAAHPYDFRSLRLVVAGAEQVKDRTRETYASRFGVRVLEGYGVTETAPVLALNTPMANRPGTVGRLSPLMEARFDPVPGVEGAGRLFVRGPNVMLGYLRAENPGVLEPPPGGWHDTGDVVAVDAEGFLTIKGRAKRFAKVAGEMVSLAAAEALADRLWPEARSLAVALPDARKGERVALLTTREGATREALLRAARIAGVPEIAVPADVMTIEAAPLLGTGKADYVAATAMAAERLGERAAA